MSPVTSPLTILDRYIIRETIPPFFLALGVYTFVLAIDPMLSQAQLLLSKGVPLGTVAFMLLTLLPQALGVTIPMSFLTGLLIALGRMSGDRESVALLACGVSPARLLRPVLVLGVVIGLADLYVMVRGVPDGNLAFVETRWKLLTEQSETDIKPRVFFERFPGMVLYINDDQPGGGWNGVLLAETGSGGRPSITPTVTTAETGRLLIDRDERLVRLELHQATRYSPGQDGSRVYSTSQQPKRQAALSTQPCDFSSSLAVGAYIATSTTVYIPFRVGSGDGYYPGLAPGSTYYLSVKNLTCDVGANCNMYMDLYKPN